MRKIIMLGVMLLAIILVAYFSYYISYITGVAGFAAAKFISGKEEGAKGRVRSLRISWRKYELHFHHWFVALVTAAILLLKGFYMVTPDLIQGFLGGVFFHGIYSYSDWHRLVRVKADYAEEPELTSEPA